jgi:hypothetical protein
METQDAGPRATEPSADPSEWSAYGSVVRLIAGAAGTGLDQLRQIEQSLDDTDEAAVDRSELTLRWQTFEALVVGFAADLPDRIERGAQGAAAVASKVQALTAPVWRLSSAVGLTPLAERTTAAARASIRTELEELVALGSTEIARGRKLVEAVFDESMDSIIDHVADSQSLDDLVREQTTGITAGAVREVRETGAAADGLTENVVRKLFRRPLRQAPEPAFETE